MKKILDEITSRASSPRSGSPRASRAAARFNALREAGRQHPIEEVGAELRAMMPWISAGKQKVSEVSGG